MELTKTVCPQCKNPVWVASHQNQVRCDWCASFFAVQRSLGEVRLISEEVQVAEVMPLTWVEQQRLKPIDDLRPTNVYFPSYPRERPRRAPTKASNPLLTEQNKKTAGAIFSAVLQFTVFVALAVFIYLVFVLFEAPQAAINVSIGLGVVISLWGLLRAVQTFVKHSKKEFR